MLIQRWLSEGNTPTVLSLQIFVLVEDVHAITVELPCVHVSRGGLRQLGRVPALTQEVSSLSM